MRVALALLLLAAVLLAVTAADQAIGTDPQRPDIVDFHPFYLAGRMAWEGHFADSYRVGDMQRLETSFGGGRDVLIPFIYPPLFGLMIAPFTLLPVAWAFLLFTMSTLTFYLVVMRRLAGDWFWPSVLAVSPVLLINIRLGQNGFLTGALAGLSAALALKGRYGLAGVAAGALAFKPQLATMLPILLAMRRGWNGLVIAAAVGLALTGLSVLALGPDTVTAFMGSLPYIGRFMAAGAFPVHRMTSIYACALSLGLPAPLALSAHGIVTLAVLALAIGTALGLGRSDVTPDRSPPAAGGARTASGLLLMATVFVSPYFFDYDLTVLGVGLALVLPRLAEGLTTRTLTCLLVALATIASSGLVLTPIVAVFPGAALSLGGPALLLCFAFICVTLRRPALLPALPPEGRPDGARWVSPED